MPLPTLPPPPGDYAAEWTEIDSLDQQGLYQSALEKVKALEARARNDKNSAQIIKTLLYNGKYTAQLEEDGAEKGIALLEKELPNVNSIEKRVIKSLLGQLYTMYLQSQGWSIQQRTPLSDESEGDLKTWSPAFIEKRALQWYAESIEEPAALLKETPLGVYKAILTPAELDSVGKEPLWESLFDLLSHRALKHFADSRSYLTEPVYAFRLDQKEAFAPLQDFIKAPFDTKDSTSGIWMAVKTWQRVLNRPGHSIIVSHGGGNRQWQDTAALVHADLLRLQFAHGNSILDDKAERYRIALDHLWSKYQQQAIGGEVAHALATHLLTFESDKGENAKRALSLCDEVIRRHPGTYGASLCEQLREDILTPQIGVVVEEVSLPQQPALVSVNVKNAEKLWLKIVRAPADYEAWNLKVWTEQLSWLAAEPALKQRDWALNAPKDYQQHTVELPVEALEYGRYFAIVANNPGFKSSLTDKVAFASFTVSALAPILYYQEGVANFAVANRLSGAPMAGVKLDFFQYNYDSGRRQLKHVGKTSTDRDGLAAMNSNQNYSIQVLATLGEDSLWIGNVHSYRRSGEKEVLRRVQFFTDRAIYRPGQTVYFKGVLFEQKTDAYGKGSAPAILPSQTVSVALYDANGQSKGKLKLRSNEYGSFNGSFMAPASGLTGQMSIRTDDGSGIVYFNVEEYKRPRFEVTMKPVEGAFKLEEQVSVKGEAKNFAGSALDGAQVRYRVVRVARFPIFDYYRYRRALPWYFNKPEMEIANGTVESGIDGSFEIRFLAQPDQSIPKKDKPVFDYRVTVDVTDITGETHSSTTTVSVGYTALQVELDIDDDIHVDSLSAIGIRTTNLAGQSTAATGVLRVQRLRDPGVAYKTRLWERPDVFVLPQTEFARMFPDLPWKDEDDPMQWPKTAQVRLFNFNTADDKEIALAKGDIQPGYYMVSVETKDAYGEKVELQKVVRVWDAQTRFVQPGATPSVGMAEPGQTLSIHFGGHAENLHFFFAQEQSRSLVKPAWVSARIQNLSKVDIPVRESDRGDIITHWFCVLNNRFYGGESMVIAVPWSNKDLQVSFETFRDKLQPGANEEWRLRISGPKKEKVAAEMVAAMYDASLDAFVPHGWGSIAYPGNYAAVNIAAERFGVFNGWALPFVDERTARPVRIFPELNLFGFPVYDRRGMYLMDRAAPMGMARAQKKSSDRENDSMPDAMMVEKMYVDGIAAAKPESLEQPVAGKTSGGEGEKSPPAGIRRNLNETVFFFPELRTDAEGNVILKFTMNEALTRWKLLTYTHSKDLMQVLAQKEVVTQKELMIIANPPRFLRQGDEIEFSAKISNLSKDKQEGVATLSLFDAATMAVVENEFGLAKNNRIARFSVLPGQSGAVSWRLKVPDSYDGAITWRISADAGGYRDGEESTIPVVSNRMLVTETMPISLRGNQSKTFVFDNLKQQNESNTLKTQRYSIEFTSNPVWYAVQSLPYLMEFPHECSEQIFSRFYANTLASSVVEKMPQIKRVYDRWKGTGAMQSNLSKNQELKYALLEETPWVLDAQSEEQQKQQIALLFDLNKMANERERALRTLAERQLSNGGWPWFSGGDDSWYISQYILCGMHHLNKLGAIDFRNDQGTLNMIDKATGYCDAKLKDHYDDLKKLVKAGNGKMEEDHLDPMAIHYLYTRSFSPADRPAEAVNYYLGQAQQYWLDKGLYQQGLLALSLHRWGYKDAAQRIVASLRERALQKEELGMYWPNNWGFYWYQMPVETQALMIEVFSEVAADTKAVEELRIWLLKNKQTNRWESTKATAEAVYALLLNGQNWLNNTKPVSISVGGKPLAVPETEAGTGYFIQHWSGAEVKKSWAELKVDNPNSNIVWGAAYWQYFEDLDKIKDFKETPLNIVKQLFLEENTPTGPVLKPITEGQILHRGDRLKVRIEIRVDRDMEFVHLKDMRAAGFEPVNVLSGYRWSNGLGYYESTKDLATHFFIDNLRRGTYVFEYPLTVSLRGDMSNGITTMQCMYAPEFTSHSKGIRVKVE